MFFSVSDGLSDARNGRADGVNEQFGFNLRRWNTGILLLVAPEIRFFNVLKNPYRFKIFVFLRVEYFHLIFLFRFSYSFPFIYSNSIH